MTVQTFKRTNEARLLGFNYSAELARGAYVLSVSSITITPQKKVAQVTALTESNRAIVQAIEGGPYNVARALFAGGTQGELYYIVCLVLCSDGQQLSCTGFLLVDDAQ